MCVCVNEYVREIISIIFSGVCCSGSFAARAVGLLPELPENF